MAVEDSYMPNIDLLQIQVVSSFIRTQIIHNASRCRKRCDFGVCKYDIRAVMETVYDDYTYIYIICYTYIYAVMHDLNFVYLG